MQFLKKTSREFYKQTKSVRILTGNLNVYHRMTKAFVQQAVNMDYEKPKVGNNVKWGSLFKESNIFDYEIKKVTKPNNPYKYKAYIFDINDVLLKFDKERIKDVMPDLRSILKHPNWLNYLNNSMKKNEVLEVIGKDLKLSVASILEILDKALHCLSPIKENVEFLKELKAKEMKLICLSNCPTDDIIKIRRKFSFFDNFDVIFSSGDLGVNKPDPKALQTVLDFYDLNAEECVFFDDSEKNIKFAESIGIKGVVCKDKKSLDEIRNLSQIRVGDEIQLSNSISMSSISKRVNLAFDFMAKYADLDKNTLFVSKVGKGTEMENSKESPSELFSTVMMMVLSKQFILSERGNNILSYMAGLHNGTGHFKFFIDLDVIPCDYDTTSLSLFVLKNSGLVSDEIINKTIDKMFLNINEDNILMTFADPKRPRVCPIVCSNILNLVYLMKREDHSCIPSTRKFIYDYLSSEKFEQGCTYYPNPDLFLYTISKLFYYYPKEFSEFREPIVTQLQKRIGVADMEDSLSLSCRLICSSIFGLENKVDVDKLLSLQKEDGSWPESLLYTTHNKAKGLYYWTNIGVTTMFGMKALELNNFNKNNTNKLTFL